MGCDIHTKVEVKNQSGTWIPELKRVFKDGDRLIAEPFDWRAYGMFGFLADVRNYSFVPCITGGTRGWPNDTLKKYDSYRHSHNFVTLKELVDFNYDQTFEDRRTTIEESPRFFNGAADAGEGNGVIVTFREFLGQASINDIEALKTFGEPENVRILMDFDS